MRQFNSQGGQQQKFQQKFQKESHEKSCWKFQLTDLSVHLSRLSRFSIMLLGMAQTWIKRLRSRLKISRIRRHPNGWRGGLTYLAVLLSVCLWLGQDGKQPVIAQMAQAETSYRMSISPGEWASASFPVENFQAYTSPFGYRGNPYGGGSEFHSGLDIAAPEGSYVRNWWEGTVTQVIDDDRCGTGLVIQSGNWEHIYCHMQGYAETIDGVRSLVDRGGGIVIEQGQALPTSARIGRVGMTGRTTGPHLHWGMIYNDEWVDPATVIRAMADAQ